MNMEGTSVIIAANARWTVVPAIDPAQSVWRIDRSQRQKSRQQADKSLSNADDLRTLGKDAATLFGQQLQGIFRPLLPRLVRMHCTVRKIFKGMSKHLQSPSLSLAWPASYFVCSKVPSSVGERTHFNWLGE